MRSDRRSLGRRRPWLVRHSINLAIEASYFAEAILRGVRKSRPKGRGSHHHRTQTPSKLARKFRKLGQYPAEFMVALATGNKMRSRPGSTPNGLLVSVPAYSRFPDGLVGVPAREQIVYCLILTREREP